MNKMTDKNDELINYLHELSTPLNFKCNIYSTLTSYKLYV
jgi:hypothetical protein